MNCSVCHQPVVRAKMMGTCVICPTCAPKMTSVIEDIDWSKWRDYEHAGFDDTNFRLDDPGYAEAVARAEARAAAGLSRQ